jgi:KEOPS complex subunit Pcc1
MKHKSGNGRDNNSDIYCCESHFCFETPYASFIYASLLSEEDVTGGRSHAVCQIRSPTHVELFVYAVDARALRAALNTWLRLFSVATEMCALSEDQR